MPTTGKSEIMRQVAEKLGITVTEIGLSKDVPPHFGKQICVLAEQEHLQAALDRVHEAHRLTTIGEFIQVYGEHTLADAIKTGRWIIVDELDYPNEKEQE